MDNLTHGLLGLAIGALRRPDAPPGARASPTDRAVLVASVLAAELPDLDTLLASGDAVTVALQAHRGLSHSLLFTPVVALGATGVARALFRGARTGPVFLASLASVLFAHLLPDLWTGWGTRLLLPFSDARLSLDWTMVVDPWVTLPLVVSAVVAWRQRARWRRALLVGLACSAAYVGARVASWGVLTRRVEATYPEARTVRVFPLPFSVGTWRYVATLPDGVLAAGDVPLAGEPREARRVASSVDALPEDVRAVRPVREALAWARFPVVSLKTVDGGREVRIDDLRYHLRGEPTLGFVIRLDPANAVTQARMERGGSASELLRRWRGGAATPATHGGDAGTPVP
ncbi:metal-dependent hydrolase [Pyxidicoccus fallax]|uniref:Metal-dependent hydrolase n=1 Tax=Pyxidicoccus fallax TaxID=394095 RepID=A0A848LPL8_9BACT|nr:metal-dependent hydrolase [Pyxidicoccus fallax]NMO19444.1 metal-dependent hydrolase [Pyxidicoccus fallax]NPC82738.1 metal-dependent hydrolase [Pyxidicoccus fallax]